MTDESLMRLPAVLEKTGLARSTLYALIRDGMFCAPVHIGARAVAWPESEVAAWINARIQQSRVSIAESGPGLVR